MQILCALKVSYSKINFNHNELYRNNILMRKCNTHVAFKYVILGKEHVIPTYGSVPIIIDYGFSQCDCGDEKMNITTKRTNNAVVNNYSNTIADQVWIMHSMEWKYFAEFMNPMIHILFMEYWA